MTSTLSDLLGQADVGLARVTDEDQVLAATCVIRHAKSEADAELLHEMLGIDDVPVPHCEPGPRIAPHLAHQRPRRTKGRGA